MRKPQRKKSQVAANIPALVLQVHGALTKLCPAAAVVASLRDQRLAGFLPRFQGGEFRLEFRSTMAVQKTETGRRGVVQFKIDAINAATGERITVLEYPEPAAAPVVQLVRGPASPAAA